MSDPSTHPEIIKFTKYLAAGRVEKHHADLFDRWRQGPKCNAVPELRAAADALWDRLQAAGGPRLPEPPRRLTPAASTGIRTQTGARGGAGSGTKALAASPKVLGAPFHNPYTFLPFGKEPRRHAPTPLSADEDNEGKTRFTGVLVLDVETMSPLLTCSPQPLDGSASHKQYPALSIGDDVIVPATGIRGSLRSLMTILTGGTLGYLDEEAWLCQGRDLNLGPAGERSPAGTPSNVFLAEVVRPGSVTRAGSLQLGTTKLILAEKLARDTRTLPRPTAGEPIQRLYTNADGSQLTLSPDDTLPWRVKLSGRPVNPKGKREGLFEPSGSIIDNVPAALWSAYQGRNAHGDHPELRKGDLVWMEAKAGKTVIRDSEDIESLQWARWGRRGERLLEVVRSKHPKVLPDNINPDGLVDEVTDLFGQVPREELVREAFPDWQKPTATQPGPAGPFAARVRPENLVFDGARKHGLLNAVTLAPLAPPHPGCAAFYRDQNDFELVANGRTGLRGYKVYRTTRERGDDAPWHFAQQAVYDDQGSPKPPRQKVNKTVDLLNEGMKGTLRIACRSLTRRELALLLAACSVDWRLGGGKPLGLGHCRITRLRVLDEEGAERYSMTRTSAAPTQLPSEIASEVDADLAERILLWQTSQDPVSFMRYPRAVIENRNKKNRGGHVWFGRHANPRKTMAADNLPNGLEVMYVSDDLALKAGSNNIAPQVLPRFDPNLPGDDVLFGYDLFIGDGVEWTEQAPNRQTFVKKAEAFDPAGHARASDRSGGNQGQSRDSRLAERGGRKTNDPE